MKEKRDREFDERRLYRRRRRIRNQIIAYITVGIFFVAIVVGAVIGVRKLMEIIAERRQAAEMERQLEEMQQPDSENAVVDRGSGGGRGGLAGGNRGVCNCSDALRG